MIDNMFKEVMHACVQQVGDTPEVEALREEQDDLDKAYTLALAYAEAMFVWGWKLRGNPDLLVELSNKR